MLGADGDSARAATAAAQRRQTTYGTPETVNACRLLAVVPCTARVGKGPDPLPDGVLTAVGKTVLLARGSGRDGDDAGTTTAWIPAVLHAGPGMPADGRATLRQVDVCAVGASARFAKAAGNGLGGEGMRIRAAAAPGEA